MFRDRFDCLLEVRRLSLAPRCQRTIVYLQILIGNHQAFIKKQLFAQSIAGWARTEGRVEREQAWLDLGDGEAADRASELFTESVAFGIAFARCGFKYGYAVRQIQCGTQGIGQAGFEPLANHDPVHNHVDIVTVFFIQCRRLIQFMEFTINFYTLKTLLAQLQKLLAVLALTIPYDRRK